MKVLIGLLTPNSISSTYVLFELGARWGAGLFMTPLLAGTYAEEVRGPHAVLNALSCETESQLIQLVEDIARKLNLRRHSAASYLKKVKVVKALAEAIPTGVLGKSSEKEEMVFEESILSVTCYDDRGKVIHLIPGSNRSMYGCVICRNSFATKEYNPCSD